MQNTIRELRKEKGLSQDELARACGVSRQTVNAIENNKYDPTLALAFRLAQVLGTPHLPYVTMELSSTERTEPNA